ncbi:MAG TPA: 6,7-dimethyl-8-ribityllumazine synthase [bacterium]|nr:6,7-dimethyl-8-ribityllumazine synthase [bacterium]HOL47348.1 6,7-dimethyl-8-ribityllumazine synthase [bacterium]HPQ17985.1 6,7-dimethyl-8-ribityllumazine synthase [bacterium]
MKKIKGKFIGENLKIGIVVSRFNEFVTDKLLEGCVDTLYRNGVKEENIIIISVPGAFEIPLAAAKLAEKELNAIICLGAVIKGDTPHFNFIAAEVTKGIATISLNNKIPVIYGIITPDNLEQAIERAGTKSGNKGREAALTAIEMANLLKEINNL